MLSLKPSSLHSPAGQPGAKVPSGLRRTCLPCQTEPSAPSQPESQLVRFSWVGMLAVFDPPPDPHSTPLSGDNRAFTAPPNRPATGPRPILVSAISIKRSIELVA